MKVIMYHKIKRSAVLTNHIAILLAGRKVLTRNGNMLRRWKTAAAAAVIPITLIAVIFPTAVPQDSLVPTKGTPAKFIIVGRTPAAGRIGTTSTAVIICTTPVQAAQVIPEMVGRF